MFQYMQIMNASVNSINVCCCFFSECRVGFYKLGSKCVATCPVQYYGYVEIVSLHNGNSNKTVATCRKCHPACNKCKGGRNTDCFECNPDYILESRQCIPKEFIESMSPYKFLIWFASIVVMLFVFYCAFRLCPQYLKQQEKQSIDQQPSQGN